MGKYRYVYGPVPSRRMGLSLGVSPIPKKFCNYSCIYCQLGRTDHLSNVRQEFFPLEEILVEVRDYLSRGDGFDVVTLVGEGEPTLYLKLGELITGIKALTDKPVAVITNGALLFEPEVRAALMPADLVLPSLDAFDEKSFRQINRPSRELDFESVYRGLQVFSLEFLGEIWVETMIVKGINDDEASLRKLKSLLEGIRYDRLFVNVPARPPAEKWVESPDEERLRQAIEILGGISMELLVSGGFSSKEDDDRQAVLSIIRRHPMNAFEIESFLESRGCTDPKSVLEELEGNPEVETVSRGGPKTYRLR
ncbi:MAG: radical SAM protein [Synergistaceae bacterium]|nr:radical SAM protein [Synergistaceae bacterium]